MSPEADAPTPTLLADRYRLERRVAQGGMAEVWLATDTALSRQVAVKLLKTQLASDPVVAERFRREAIAVASITHPNIVSVYDAVEADGRQAVVMQYVQGKTLRQLLDEQRTLSPELTVHIGSALAAALDAAHSAGLVHRDVKPGNVLVTPEGRVLLADFGIAKALGTGDDLTSDNVMMGTAKYLSPEQVRGRRLDGRADLYSLGLVLYECLAGRVPFLGETDADTALARLQRDATDLVQLRPTLPRNLAVVVHRLLEREPEERYPTGAAVRAALSQALSDRPPAPVDPDATDIDHGRPQHAMSDRPAATVGTGLAATSATGSAASGPTVLDPGLATGQVTVTPPPRATASSVRDRTPAVGAPRTATRPGMQQRLTPSMIVLGVVLVVALVVALVIWSSIGSDAPGGSVSSATMGASSATAAPDGPVRIARIRAFDPEGDGSENDQLAERAVDSDPRTAWYTVCYSSPYFGGKSGVGLVVELTAPVSGVITIDVATGPWSVHVFGSDDVPTDLGGWGNPIATDFGNAPDVMTVDLGKKRVRNLLVLMKQAAPSDSCSSANPNRAGIAEIGLGFD